MIHTSVGCNGGEQQLGLMVHFGNEILDLVYSLLQRPLVDGVDGFISICVVHTLNCASELGLNQVQVG